MFTIMFCIVFGIFGEFLLILRRDTIKNLIDLLQIWIRAGDFKHIINL